MEKYKSQLRASGSKFVVRKRVPGVYEGTVGFLVYFRGTFGHNIAKFSAVITRRGRGGVPRVETMELKTPVFDFDHESLGQIIPLGDRYMVQVDWVDEKASITGMDSFDFAGWALSRSMMLKTLCSRGGEGPFGGGLQNGPVKFGGVWPYNDPFLNGAYRLKSKFENTKIEQFEQDMQDMALRLEILNSMRNVESKLVRRSLRYAFKLAEIERNSAMWLYDLRKANVFEGADLDLLANSVKSAGTKVTKLSGLMEQKAHAVKASQQKANDIF
jgi:hypothetical protein